MKYALLSVSDKTGIIEFAKGLLEHDYQLISTGGTYKLLQEHGLTVTYIEAITESPEILGGRVKTLHPRIHGGILALDNSQHLEELNSIGGVLIDLVAVNLYPFEKVSQDPAANFTDVIENIDIGGPTLLRAAAKNHARVTAICDPTDYPQVLKEIKSGGIEQEKRKELAAKVFRHTAFYDSLIANYMTNELFPATMTLALEKVDDLRYGENPHQQAAYYRQIPTTGTSLDRGEQLSGKALSFNNIYDSEAAWQLAALFDQPCAVAVKHSNPCGLALGEDLYEAYSRCYDSDPVSIFGGIVACNREVDLKTAKEMGKIFLEVIIAPDFSPEAISHLSKKPNLRLLKMATATTGALDYKRVTGGFLLQETDRASLDPEQLKVVTKRHPTSSEWEDLLFGWKIVKFVKSNAIVLCKDNQLIGVGAGQMNRVQSVRLSTEQAGEKSAGASLASDAFFPFADNIESAAAEGITAIIQPGGSIRDQEVIDACNQYNIAMVFTGMRHFRH